MPEPTGRDLEAAIAERVMGLVACDHWVPTGSPYWGVMHQGPCAGGGAHCYPHAEPPRYSTDWSAMQAVVERMAALGHFFELVSRPGGSFMARFRTQNTPEAGNLYRNADTAPEAVCRAALAALAALSGAATEPHADPS